MKVLVCSRRDYADRDHLNNTLDYLHQQYNFTLLIQGAARGADRLAGVWATRDSPQAIKLIIVLSEAPTSKYSGIEGMLETRSACPPF
jgi:hypothetical protein